MGDSWASNSTTCTTLRLVGAPNGADAKFHPSFTYPIYGEAETVYGYKCLEIQLDFASGSLVPHLQVHYKAKNEATTATIDDVEAKLKEFLPPDCIFASDGDFDAALKLAFEPLGTKVHSYTRRKVNKGKGKSGARAGGPALAEDDPEARVFEIYQTTWATPGFREYHRRMQLFALLFIEGASYIHEDETNWEFYTLLEKVNDGKQTTWHFVGYTSLYKFWCWPDSSRIRLSQFVIAPPYQKQGHGASLYSTVYDEVAKRSSVTEMTVEDPSEDFDRLRDGNDLRRLLAPGGFVETAKKANKLHAPVDAAWCEQERLQRKIAPRQWARMLEIVQLMNLDATDIEQVRHYRLQVKARIFKQNKDILLQLERNEQKTKLQETFEGVVEEYADMVGVDIDPILEAGEADGDDVRPENGHGQGPPRKLARMA